MCQAPGIGRSCVGKDKLAKSDAVVPAVARLSKRK